MLHSCLLVPYWSWKYSHSAHHKNTNSCENDEVFVPPTRKEVSREMFHDTPLGNAISIFAMLTIGWCVAMLCAVWELCGGGSDEAVWPLPACC